MITIYDSKPSGNCYKVRLTCSILQLDCQWIELDLFKKETRKPEFLAINPLGQVPVLIDEQGDSVKKLLESNAIIYYLAQGTDLIPQDAFLQAKMWQWLLFEQTDIRPNMAAIRFIKKFQNMSEDRLEEYQTKFAKAQNVLAHLDSHLSDNDFFLGDKLSLADISIYAYTHVVDEGGIELASYPNLCQWFKRIEALPHYISLI